jgi:holliday junction DNA helicase RuvA
MRKVEPARVVLWPVGRGERRRMIGKLSGIIDQFGADFILLNVGGVGYIVHCSGRTLAQSGQVGDPLSLLIDMQVREDAMNLYGFRDAGEQQWFRLLTSVQGVGAKVGMAILSACPSERLGFAIASGDKAMLTQADGVGPKLGIRIITELKDKVAKMDVSFMAQKPSISAQSAKNMAPAATSADQDAVSALVNLGYARADAFEAVLAAKQKANDNDQELKVETLIKLALKELSA